MKLNKQKTKIIMSNKDYKVIFHHNGYTIFDSNFIIIDEYIELENTLFQYRINNNETFGYNTEFEREFTSDTTQIEVLYNAKPKELLNLTNLYYKAGKQSIRLLTNPWRNCTILINEDYCKFFELLNGAKITGTDELSQVACHNEDKLLFLVMPIKNDAAFSDIYQFSLDNTKEIREV